MSATAERTGAPTASRLILCAAVRYRSSRPGSRPPRLTLSKPALESSAGSNAVTSTSRWRRSRIAFRYSVALRRRSASLRPGSGLDAAARSSSASRYAVRLTYDSRSGRGRPAGGIIPARSFLTTFSQTSALSPTFATSHRVERDTTGAKIVVVTGNAVPIKQRALGRAGLLAGRRGGRRREEHQARCDRRKSAPHHLSPSSGKPQSNQKLTHYS